MGLFLTAVRSLLQAVPWNPVIGKVAFECPKIGGTMGACVGWQLGRDWKIVQIPILGPEK